MSDIYLPRGKPLPELTSIELPCFVRSPDQALRIIQGGKQTIDACTTAAMMSGLHHQIYASLDGNPGGLDTLAGSPPALLPGTARPSQGLLVRVVRRRVRGADGTVVRESVAAEIIGKVTKEYQFSTPFDYQFVAGSDDVKITCPNSGEEVCEIVPQPFRVTLDPEAVSALFAPKDSTSAADAVIQLKKSQKHSRHPGVRVRVDDPVVNAPPEDIIATLNKVRRNQTYGKLCDEGKVLVQSAFAVRPVWLRSALENLVMPDGACTLRDAFFGPSKYVLREVICAGGFTYLDGPWARTWVRYGMNVREVPECRWYQIVTVSISKSKLKEIQRRIRGQSLGYRVAEFHLDSRTVVLDARTPSDESGAAQSGPALFLYGVELNPVTYYQLCDVGDFDFLEYASTLKRMSSCSAKTGWFSAPTWAEVKRRVIDAVHRALSEARDYMDDFGIYLRAALAKALRGDKTPYKALQCSALLLDAEGEPREDSLLHRYLSIPDVIATENDILVETISAITGANKELNESKSEPVRTRRGRPKSSGSKPRAPSKRAARAETSGLRTAATTGEPSAAPSASGRRGRRSKGATKEPSMSSIGSDIGSNVGLQYQSSDIEQLLPSLRMLNEVEAFDIFGGSNEFVESEDNASGSESSGADGHGSLSESSYSRTESSGSEVSDNEAMDVDLEDDMVATNRKLDQARALGLGSHGPLSHSSRISNETVDERILRELSSINTVYTV